MLAHQNPPNPQVAVTNAIKDPTNIGNVLSGMMQVVPFDRLKEAVVRQMEQGGEIALGMVLVAMGLVTDLDVNWALKIQEALRKGDLLEAKMLVMRYQNERIERSMSRQADTVGRGMEAVCEDCGDEHHCSPRPDVERSCADVPMQQNLPIIKHHS